MLKAHVQSPFSVVCHFLFSSHYAALAEDDNNYLMTYFTDKLSFPKEVRHGMTFEVDVETVNGLKKK